jgi:hypothetical protein
MQSPSRKLLAPVLGFLARLRHRTLFLIALGLLAVDLVVPDFIPFVDEVLLAIATIVLARRRKPAEEEIDITPPRP